MKSRFFLFPIICSIAAGLMGCMSQQALDAKLKLIENKHGVIIKAENALSRCFLFGDVAKLLDSIDQDLENSPQYFKSHIGYTFIEETFVDNPDVFILDPLLRGYVDVDDWRQKYPIHIKNRSIIEKILFYGTGEEQLFLHEAMHSFELNIYAEDPNEWERFYGEFTSAQNRDYEFALPLFVALSGLPLDSLGLRPTSMPSFYGALNHQEDVAETYCYLRRHSGQVECLKVKDPALYKKCLIVEKFTQGGYYSVVVAKD